MVEVDAGEEFDPLARRGVLAVLGGDAVGQFGEALPGDGRQEVEVGGEVAAGRAVGDTGAAGDLAQREGLGSLGVHELDAGPDEPPAQPVVPLFVSLLFVSLAALAVSSHRHCLPSPSRQCLPALAPRSVTLDGSEGE